MAKNTKFLDAIAGRNTQSAPVWFMRQSGRYLPKYQEVRKKFSFEQICKTPELAATVADFPVNDFNLDVAILFSDILYTLDALGQKVIFNDAPQFAWHIETKSDISKYHKGSYAADLDFQYRALEIMKAKNDVTILGFAGGPATLFHFACKKSTTLEFAYNFFDAIIDTYIDNLILQAQSGADALAIFDSSASELCIFDNKYQVLLHHIVQSVQSKVKIPMLYYIKNATIKIAQAVENAGFSCIGVDENSSIDDILNATNFAVSGNFYNDYLTKPMDEFHIHAEGYITKLQKSPRFISSISHGILPNTHTENVRFFTNLSRRVI